MSKSTEEQKPAESVPKTPAESVPKTPGAQDTAPPGLSWEETLAHLDRHLRENPEARIAFREHDVIAGIAGEIGERIAARRLQESRASAAEEAQRAKEQELLRMADEDPEAFAAKFKTEKQAEIARKELQALAFNERKALASHLGRAVNDLPEMREATTDELAGLAQAVVGVPDEQVIAAWSKAVVDLIAHKRGEKLLASNLEERLKAERAAWEAERAGATAKTGQAPSIRRGEGNPSTGPPDFRTEPKAFDAWYEENILKRPRRTE